MQKITRLKICAYFLVALVLIMFASAVQLEANPYGLFLWVWLHIFIGVIFLGFIFWHCALNKKSLRVFFNKARRESMKNGMRWLYVFFLLTLISAIAALIHWLTAPGHSPIGGVHGKIAFFFLFMAIVHAFRHKNFFRIRK